MTDARLKFQQKLRELFQFESADLDFGIYRIMNYRRAAIERFIEKDLLDAVSKELASGTVADQVKAAEELEKLRERIVEDIAEDAVDADGVLDEKHRGTRLGKQYLDLQARLGGGKGKAEHEALVFNHLYTFFGRYYDAGDFLSLRRYWDNEKVKLHEKLKDFTYTKKSGKASIQLERVDSFIITETPLEVLQAHFADWTQEQLEDSHILIAKEGQTDYLRRLFA